jgi:hypothetical protein
MSISTSELVARYFAASLMIVSASHFAQPVMWRDLFIDVRRTGYAGIIIAMFTLPLGLVIVIAHNVWVPGIPVVVTVAGWGMVIKSVTYLLIRRRADKMIPDGPRAVAMYRWAGALGVIAGALVLYDSIRRGA